MDISLLYQMDTLIDDFKWLRAPGGGMPANTLTPYTVGGVLGITLHMLIERK
jgi:hypothetical protein